jgi:hypothetical protein
VIVPFSVQFPTAINHIPPAVEMKKPQFFDMHALQNRNVPDARTRQKADRIFLANFKSGWHGAHRKRVDLRADCSLEKRVENLPCHARDYKQSP